MKVRVVSSEFLKQQFLLFVRVVEFIIINNIVYVHIGYIIIQFIYECFYLLTFLNFRI